MEGPGSVQAIFVFPSGIWKEDPSPVPWELCPSQGFVQLNPSHGFPAFPSVFLGIDKSPRQLPGEFRGFETPESGQREIFQRDLGTPRSIPNVEFGGLDSSSGKIFQGILVIPQENPKC